MEAFAAAAKCSWLNLTAPLLLLPETGFLLEIKGHIRAYAKSHPDWEKEDFKKVACQFVEMEIAAHSNLASAPVSELEVGKDGRVHWLALGACALSRGD